MAQFDVYPRDHNTDAVFNDVSQTIAQSTATLSIDPANGSMVIVNLTANVTAWTLVSANIAPGQYVTISFVQDATGSRTLAGLTNTNIRWMNTTYGGTTAGSAPTLTTTASKADTFHFRWDGTRFTCLGLVFNQT
jgi:hypothetical protein